MQIAERKLRRTVHLSLCSLYFSFDSTKEGRGGGGEIVGYDLFLAREVGPLTC